MYSSNDVIEAIYRYAQSVNAFERPGMLAGMMADDELHRLIDELGEDIREIEEDEEELQEACFHEVSEPAIKDMISRVTAWVSGGRVTGLDAFLSSMFYMEHFSQPWIIN